ncbi:MAG: type I-C CRISPR-associated protein Cas5 [Deltaproteobacteria bacterium]|nr:type I-C CRISPR-associated protein Cas5 [Deltaproteobacteria bacterium]
MSEPEVSRVMRLKVWGDNACFTRPEMKVERVSYDVMTPSAARGILEAILWKPAIKWHIKQIDVLKAIRWESVRRNEVGVVMSTDLAITAMKKGSGNLGVYVEDERQQRAGLFLKDVSYTIHAYFELTEKAGPADTVIKFQEMFLRRAEKGQCFNRPYLGCREFSAHFEPLLQGQELPETFNGLPERLDLGWMLHDLDFSKGLPNPRFFRAVLEKGRMTVPRFDSNEVRG